MIPIAVMIRHLLLRLTATINRLHLREIHRVCLSARASALGN